MIESLIQAQLMGLKTIITDHSLFQFDSEDGIHLNVVTKYITSNINHAIAVSHTCKENFFLRSKMEFNKVSVVPNAVDTARFVPDPTKRYPLNKINIVVLSRLTYRKGIDLLVDIIPAMCKRYPEIHFIIGGDGPKMTLLKQLVAKNGIQDRVELLGSIPSNKVPEVLVRGHIFLNISLTESFCIAIVEAASCGLLVVTTKVGGVSEVLPPDMIFVADPNPSELIDQLEKAIA